MSENNPYGVKVGQVWRSMDYREPYSFKKVVSVDDDLKASMLACSPNGSRTYSQKSRILLRRFKPTSTGYELIN